MRSRNKLGMTVVGQSVKVSFYNIINCANSINFINYVSKLIMQTM
jgi:hypothetical protein